MDIHSKEVPVYSFELQTGREKYQVIDLDTNGATWHNDKMSAYRRMALIQFAGHTYRLEVR